MDNYTRSNTALDSTTFSHATTTDTIPRVEGGYIFESASTTPRDQHDLLKRIMIISNLHPDVDQASIRLFFVDYQVIAFTRCVNRQTRDQYPQGLVILGSLNEQNHALQHLNGLNLMGRQVELQVAKNVARVNVGFVPPGAGSGAAPERNDSDYPSPFRSVSDTGSRVFMIVLARHESLESTAAAHETPEIGLSDRSPPVANHLYKGPSHSTSTPVWELAWPTLSWKLARYVRSQSTIDGSGSFTVEFSSPWNMAGNDNEISDMNMVTEEEWNAWFAKEQVKYR